MRIILQTLFYNFCFLLRLIYINGDIIMLTEKCIFTLSNEITRIEFYKIENILSH